jgi:hypothetical protein
VSSIEVQQQRKGEAISAAVEAIERSGKPDTPHLDAARAEVLAPDEYRLTAIVAELAEMTVRQERVLNHLEDHVVPSQDKEIQALKEHIKALESSGSEAAKSSGSSRSQKKNE